MPKVFSVASWNVEHFTGDTKTSKARVKRVAEFISGKDGGPASVPEVFALYEVEGKDVYKEFMKTFPDHRFHLTEGKQTQEIFVGVHKNLQTFSTQRLDSPGTYTIALVVKDNQGAESNRVTRTITVTGATNVLTMETARPPRMKTMSRFVSGISKYWFFFV